MKSLSIVAALALALASASLAGCSDSANNSLTETPSNQTTDGETDLTILTFSGATFVSVITSSIGTINAGDRTSPNQVIKFGSDTVTSTQSGVTETGQYIYIDDETLVAQFPDRDITFSANGEDLIWDSLDFERATSYPINSQENLKAFLDGSTYESVEQLDIGENSEGGLVLGNWFIRVIGDELNYGVQDTVSVGTYSYLDGSSFTINFTQRDVSAVLLDRDRLVVDSVIYQKALTDQFNSQETLVAFLNGQTYKSVGLKPIATTNEDISKLGSWFIDFIDNTYSQTLEDSVEAGTVVYKDNRSFSAVTDTQTYIVDVENDELVWDGTRYKRTIGE